MTMLDTPPTVETVIPIPHDLDIATMPRFRQTLEEAVRTNPWRLVVDFAACRYLDAQAIRVLLDIHQELWCGDGRLVLRACNADVTRLLALAGVLNVFLLEPGPAIPA